MYRCLAKDSVLTTRQTNKISSITLRKRTKKDASTMKVVVPEHPVFIQCILLTDCTSFVTVLSGFVKMACY